MSKYVVEVTTFSAKRGVFFPQNCFNRGKVIREERWRIGLCWYIFFVGAKGS